jgi:hypothetical protein
LQWSFIFLVFAVSFQVAIFALTKQVYLSSSLPPSPTTYFLGKSTRQPLGVLSQWDLWSGLDDDHWRPRIYYDELYGANRHWCGFDFYASKKDQKRERNKKLKNDLITLDMQLSLKS